MQMVSADSEMVAGGDDVDNVDDGDQEETSNFETHVKNLATKWTDEKHIMYLKSIEASFVDQLYTTVGKFRFAPPRNASIESKLHLRSSITASACKFKALRGGCWRKMNVGRGEVQLHGQSGSIALLSNWWIRHYRHSERDQSLPCRFTGSLILKTSNAINCDPMCPVFTNSNLEASGQNFGTGECDNMEEKSSILWSAKQVKTMAPVSDSTSQDPIEAA